jgi:hypothetical protein
MIETRHLFPILDQKLIELLDSLTPEEWLKPTVAKLWNVKNVASHLLDGNLRALSTIRDGHSIVPDRPINSHEDLVGYLNQLNADWVKASDRIGTRVLTELLQITGLQYSACMQSLDPKENAIFSVAWAGESVSKNWFHVAREYTEKWHHQQQIREAVGKPGIITKELFNPFIDTLLQGLPHTYRNVAAPQGTVIAVEISSKVGGAWLLTKQEQGWRMGREPEKNPESSILISPDTAWKLFTKGLSAEEAPKNIAINGNHELASHVLRLVAVMA